MQSVYNVLLFNVYCMGIEEEGATASPAQGDPSQSGNIFIANYLGVNSLQLVATRRQGLSSYLE